MAEAVTRVTYARVARGATPAAATERHHDAGLDVFLIDHVTELRGFAAGKVACPAVFVEDDARDLFETLRTGDKQQFLDAAHQVTTRLIGKMTGATADGLLVCVQLTDGTTQTAAVLKLQVVTPHAANLQMLDSGEVLLSAVTDVMDAPGNLQKGALVNDDRDGSEVVMGDVASIQAQYFPAAFGISIEQRSNLGLVDTLQVIRELQGEQVEADVRAALPDIPSGDVPTVLAAIGESVPALAEPTVRQTIEDRLAARPRPVRNVDTDVPLIERITASGVIITAPMTGEDRIVIEPNTIKDGWDITIHVDEQPTREVRRS